MSAKLKNRLGFLDFSQPKDQHGKNNLFEVDLIIEELLEFANRKSKEKGRKNKTDNDNDFPVSNNINTSSLNVSTEQTVLNEHPNGNQEENCSSQNKARMVGERYHNI